MSQPSSGPAVEAVSVDAPPLVGPVMMSQDWRDLTFLHWAVEPERVRRLMPPGVRPDVHEGASYVGLVPFRMVDAGVARGPAVPWAGSFLETNVRLYSVDETGRRGIVFLSLDSDRSLVVAGARAAFGQGRYSLWTGDPGVAVYLWHCTTAEPAFPTIDVL